jgi:hypothetical protein
MGIVSLELGFRVIAVTVLPLDKNSLIYGEISCKSLINEGSSNAGQTILTGENVPGITSTLS